MAWHVVETFNMDVKNKSSLYNQLATVRILPIAAAAAAVITQRKMSMINKREGVECEEEASC